MERLKPFSTTLSQATEFFIQHRLAAERGCTVPNLITKVIESKRQSARSKATCLIVGIAPERLVFNDESRVNRALTRIAKHDCTFCRAFFPYDQPTE